MVASEDDAPSGETSTAGLRHEGGLPRATSDLEAGTRVGEYDVQSKLGEGGFGTVYRAVHPVIHKYVAIKVLNPRLASSPEAISRFIAEARAVNQIRHKNLVDVFAFGTLGDGRHYFVMDLLEGITLREHLRKMGRLSPSEAIAILRPLAEALDAAHAKGFAHRDFKPENVFLVRADDGTLSPKLIDFGLAKLIGDGKGQELGHRTATGAPVGTPKYMSPEQCRGEGVDQRTDVYSLGVVAHELITGSRPFEKGTVLDLLIKHTTVPPPPMSSICKELSPALDIPVLQMLAKKPEERPQSLVAAIDALARAAESGESAARARAAALLDGRWKIGIALATVAGSALLILALRARHEAEPTGAIVATVAPAIAPSPSSSGAQPAGSSQDAIVNIDVRSTPALVDVYLGDAKLGTSAEAIRLSRSDTKMKLTVKAAGYSSTDIEVTPNANGFVSVTLQKAPPAKKSPRPLPPELESPFPR